MTTRSALRRVSFASGLLGPKVCLRDPSEATSDYSSMIVSTATRAMPRRQLPPPYRARKACSLDQATGLRPTTA